MLRTSFVMFVCLTSGASAGGFQFEGTKVVSIVNAARYASLDDVMSVKLLRRRFPAAKIGLLRGDCGGTCALITSPVDGSLRVEWGEHGQTYLIYSDAKGSRDTYGIKLGSSLKEAAGAKATCDQGEDTTCKSLRVVGVSYVPDGCPLKADPGATIIDIPDCATVGGFEITR